MDKEDLKLYSEFIQTKVYDLLVIAQAAARASDRGMMEAWDLPLTKGLQESMHRFRKLEEEIELTPILEQLAVRPQLDRRDR